MVKRSARGHFATLLGGLHFQRLESLELGGWVLVTKAFRLFLRAHAATLRELCLIDNIVLGDSIRLAKWGGRKLALTGMLIVSIPYIRRALVIGGDHSLALPSREPTVVDISTEPLDDLWLSGRHNHLAHLHPSRCADYSVSARHWMI